LRDGFEVAPRGMRTLELAQHTTSFDMSRPVVLCPGRKLSYTFLAAEALWILAGDDRVETIAPYNPNIAQFSDDGVHFAGAYGAPIVAQFDYVVSALLRDRDTRQAGLTIWRPNPPPSKDVPCTVAIWFSIRADRLNCHVFMRSSDAWLGLPYDVFVFSMLAAKVACAYNAPPLSLARDATDEAPVFTTLAPIGLGWLHLTAASEHLYARDFEAAKACVVDDVTPRGDPLPEAWIANGDWLRIEASLVACRDKTDHSSYWRIRP
jgi:thymidylate synthase